MVKKYQKSPLAWGDITYKKHPWIGVSWPIIGSKGSSYEVDMTPSGFTCTCPGFGYHGRCKHITAIGEKLVIDIKSLG